MKELNTIFREGDEMKPGWYVIQMDQWSRWVIPKRHESKELAEAEADKRMANTLGYDMYTMFVAEYCEEGDLPVESN